MHRVAKYYSCVVAQVLTLTVRSEQFGAQLIGVAAILRQNTGDGRRFPDSL